MKKPSLTGCTLLFFFLMVGYALFRAFTDLGPRWPLVLLAGLFLLFFALDVAGDLRRERKAARPLEEDCDPEPLLHHLEGRLAAAAPARANLRTQLSYVNTLFLLGRQEEGEQALLRAKAFLPQKEGAEDRIYCQLLEASVLLLRDDLSAARAILERSAALLEGRIVQPNLRRSLENVTLQLRIQAADPGDERLESDLRLRLAKAGSLYDQVCASAQLGRYYLSRGDGEAARPHLELAAEKGNKLALRARAQELLAGLPG